MTTDGIHSMSYAAYAAAAGVSKSMLDGLAYPLTPAHFKAARDEPDIPTEAQHTGVLLHRSLLEPETMKGAFCVRPKGLDMRTKAGKEWREAQGGLPELTHNEAVTIEKCVASLWAHPNASRMIKSGEFEVGLFATDSRGTLRKCRPDVLHRTGSNVLCDVKTCASAAAPHFEKQIVNYRYHVQAAYYLDLCKLLGIEKEHFCFLCVEKTPPYAVAVYDLEPDVIRFGRTIYQRDLQVYRNCVESGEWPGYPTDITTIGVPMYARREMENAA